MKLKRWRYVLWLLKWFICDIYFIIWMMITCALRATASHEPSSGPPCSSRQTWRGVTEADMCSEILLFSRLLEGLLQEKHIPINAWSIGPGSFPSRYPSFFHPILLIVNYKLIITYIGFFSLITSFYLPLKHYQFFFSS